MSVPPSKPCPIKASSASSPRADRSSDHSMSSSGPPNAMTRQPRPSRWAVRAASSTTALANCSGAPFIDPEVSTHTIIGPRSRAVGSGAARARACPPGSRTASTSTASSSQTRRRDSASRARHSLCSTGCMSWAASAGTMRESCAPRRMPRTSPGASGSRVVRQRTGTGGNGPSAGCGSARSGAARGMPRPRRRISATISGAPASSALRRRASAHSRLFNRPCSASQRSMARSPRPSSRALISSQPARCTVHSCRNSSAIASTACARACQAGRSIRRSRCHNAVRATCKAAAGTPCASAGRPSSPITRRSGATACGSPRSASAGGKAPSVSATNQRGRSRRRSAGVPTEVISAPSHSSRGKPSSASNGRSTSAVRMDGGANRA